MPTTRHIDGRTKRTRWNKLKKTLEDRHCVLMHEVHGRIREARTDSTRGCQVLDEGETSEVDTQDDIEFALLQMKAETLNSIDTALRRINEGTYGCCFECGGEIAEARLRALPFATRCKDCEEAYETSERRERGIAQRHGSSALVFDLLS